MRWYVVNGSWGDFAKEQPTDVASIKDGNPSDPRNIGPDPDSYLVVSDLDSDYESSCFFSFFS